jgi:hypothetical protein
MGCGDAGGVHNLGGAAGAGHTGDRQLDDERRVRGVGEGFQEPSCSAIVYPLVSL